MVDKLIKGIVYIYTKDHIKNWYVYEGRSLMNETYYAYHFTYHNKFGSGKTIKHEFNDDYLLSNLLPAPKAMQILYGTYLK